MTAPHTHITQWKLDVEPAVGAVYCPTVCTLIARARPQIKPIAPPISPRQEEALLVVEDFTARVRDLQEGPGMPSEDVDYFSAKVCCHLC